MAPWGPDDPAADLARKRTIQAVPGLLTYALVVEGLSGRRADFAPHDGCILLLAGGTDDAPGRRITQQPSLFDFAREGSEVVLAGP